MNVGKTIKAFRKQKDMTLKAFGEAINLSESCIWTVEKNRRKCFQTYEKIAKALNVPLCVLFFLASSSEEFRGTAYAHKFDSILKELKEVVENI